MKNFDSNIQIIKNGINLMNYSKNKKLFYYEEKNVYINKCLKFYELYVKFIKSNQIFLF